MITPPPRDAVEALRQGGPQRLRVLVVAASPLLEQQPLHIRREWQLLRRELTEGALPTTLVRLLPPSRETLVRTLERATAAQVPAHVLHFAGHGEIDHLLFETHLGEPFPYPRNLLASDLRGRGIRLAFLNACKTASLSSLSLARDLVASGVLEAAIGHEEPIGDDAALLFAASLYRGLCQGARLRDAFAVAEQALAGSFPSAARKTHLFGDGDIHFRELGAGEPRAPLAFDGTSGRGRVPEVPHFFGRSEELVSIGRWLDATDKRALALSGLGGIGKTALALEAAARHAWRFPGGSAFSSLRTQTLGAPTAESLLLPLGASLGLLPAPQEELVERLFGSLQEQPALLILDQLEDLPPAELERLLRILEQLPLNGSKALLTLRTAPQILREWPWLQPITLTTGLSPRAGAAYVVHAARGKVPELAHQPGHAGPYADLPLRLSQALGGHPRMLDIAVGIAAAQGVLALERSLPGLSQPGRAAGGPAAETLEARMETFLESTSKLLDNDGQWVLSLFPLSPDGTFSRDELLAAARGAERAAGRSAPPASRITAGLSSCLRAGLLDHEPQADVYRIHSTVQWHVSRKPSSHGTGALRGLIEYCLTYTNTHLQDLDRIEPRFQFVMGIFERAWREEAPSPLREAVRATVDRMRPFLLTRTTHWPELSRWLERLDARRGEPDVARAERLYSKSVLLFGQGKIAEARQCIQESIELYRGQRDLRGYASALDHLSVLEMVQGNFREARLLLEQCRELLSTVGDLSLELSILQGLGAIAFREGRFHEARTLHLEALKKDTGEGDPQRLRRANTLMMLGIIASCLGNPEESRDFLKESMALLEATGDPLLATGALQLLARTAAAQGNLEEARAMLAQALKTRTSSRADHGRAGVLLQLAAFERLQGQDSQVSAYLNQALEIYEREDHPQGRALLLLQIIAQDLSHGRTAQVRERLEQAQEILQREGDQQNFAVSLYYASMLEYIEGHSDHARARIEQALAIQTRIGDEIGLAESLYQLSLIEGRAGQDAQAEEHLRESLRLKESHGNRHGRGTPLTLLAQIVARQGRVDEAREHLHEAIELFEETGDPQLPMARWLLLTLEEPLARAEEPTPPRAPWGVELTRIVQRDIKFGHAERALMKVRAAIATHAREDDPRNSAALRAYEAQLLAVTGRHHEARETAEKALAIAEEAGLGVLARDIRGLQQTLERLAR